MVKTPTSKSNLEDPFALPGSASSHQYKINSTNLVLFLAIKTLYGISSFDQFMALLAASAFAQAGGHDPSRNILKTVLRLFLMARGEFDPSAAAAAINKATQAGRKQIVSELGQVYRSYLRPLLLRAHEHEPPREGAGPC